MLTHTLHTPTLNISRKQKHGAKQMADTLKQVNEILGHTANTSRSVEIAIRDANLATRSKGFWYAISSFFGG